MNIVLAGALILELAGCAPTESANPWAEFRPAPSSLQKDAAGPEPAGSIGERPSASIAVQELSVDLEDAPRFNPGDSGKHLSLQRKRPLRTEQYPPPAPPADESVFDARQYALADKPPVPPDAKAEVPFDVPAHWTGAVIYCQPGCVPCALEIRDLRKAGWKCGVGDGNHFKIVELPTLADFEKRGVPSTPQTVYFVDGVEQPPRVTGYGGTSTELAAIVNRHPRAKRFSRVGTALQSSGCTCQAGGACLCDGNCQCVPLVSATQSAMSCVASPLWYEAAPAGCGAPAPGDLHSETYSAPVHVATPLYAPPGVTIGPAVHSAQLSLFGFPLIGGSVGTAVNW